MQRKMLCVVPCYDIGAFRWVLQNMSFDEKSDEKPGKFSFK